MLLEKMNWKMVEEYLKHDDRIVLVLGATEEHGPNSLATDTLCPWEIARCACENQQVLLGPALPYGPSHFSLDFPGTISMTAGTYMGIIKDMLNSVVRSGFKRILLFSGHGGNTLAKNVITEYMVDRPELTIKFREWYLLPNVYAKIKALGGSEYEHGSWLESFPWINQPEPIPAGFKPQDHVEDYYALSAAETRLDAGDGMLGGAYTQPEPVMREYFDICVKDLETFLEKGWSKTEHVPN